MEKQIHYQYHRISHKYTHTHTHTHTYTKHTYTLNNLPVVDIVSLKVLDVVEDLTHIYTHMHKHKHTHTLTNLPIVDIVSLRMLDVVEAVTLDHVVTRTSILMLGRYTISTYTIIKSNNVSILFLYS